MGGSANDYIQDGLVFMLDGINKGDDAIAWTDLIGGVKFAYNSHSTVNTDNVEMDGSGCIIADSLVGTVYDKGTIEAALYVPNTNSGIIFNNAANQGISIMQAGAGVSFASSSTNILCQWDFSNKLLNNTTISISDEHIIRNLEEVFATKTSNTWNVGIYSTIGGRNYGSPYNKAFKMFSLRIYNRKLTVAEMLHNQQIDNQRFNLGINT